MHLTKPTIIAVSLVSLAIVIAIVAVIVYYLGKKTRLLPTVTSTPPQATDQPASITLLAPALSKGFITKVQYTPCALPSPVPTQTPASDIYTNTPKTTGLHLPLKPGRFAASQQQQELIALGNMEGKQNNWCRQVFFVRVTSKGFDTTADPPINFGPDISGQTPPQNIDVDLIGLVDDKLQLIAIDDALVPQAAFVVAEVFGTTNVRTIAYFAKGADGKWGQPEKDEDKYLFQHPLPVARSSFGNVIFFRNQRLYVSAQVSATSSSVQVFVPGDKTWAYMVDISPNDDTGSDFGAVSFGSSIAGTILNDVTKGLDQVFVGAPDLKVNGVSSSGAVYIFQIRDSDGQYEQVPFRFQLEDPVENDRFGASIFLSLDGTFLVVGAPGGQDSGHVYTYHRATAKDNFTEKPHQVLSYPRLTGSSPSIVNFGTSIVGSNQGEIIAISSVDVRVDTQGNPLFPQSSYNKLIIYRRDMDTNLLMIGPLEPQILGKDTAFGAYANIQVIGESQVQLLAGNPTEGNISAYSYDATD
jgi:hypothetical protein